MHVFVCALQCAASEQASNLKRKYKSLICDVFDLAVTVYVHPIHCTTARQGKPHGSSPVHAPVVTDQKTNV